MTHYTSVAEFVVMTVVFPTHVGVFLYRLSVSLLWLRLPRAGEYPPQLTNNGYKLVTLFAK